MDATTPFRPDHPITAQEPPTLETQRQPVNHQATQPEERPGD
jgi:hypothetical protein